MSKLNKIIQILNKRKLGVTELVSLKQEFHFDLYVNESGSTKGMLTYIFHDYDSKVIIHSCDIEGGILWNKLYIHKF